LGPEPDAPSAYFCSAEDIVLQKLLWFRKGAGVSERQWNDLLAVLKVQANALDYDYLKRWAAELGVAELLVRAFDDAGIG
jgi:hypothetical protein